MNKDLLELLGKIRTLFLILCVPFVLLALTGFVFTVARTIQGDPQIGFGLATWLLLTPILFVTFFFKYFVKRRLS